MTGITIPLYDRLRSHHEYLVSGLHYLRTQGPLLKRRRYRRLAMAMIPMFEFVIGKLEAQIELGDRLKQMAAGSRGHN